MRKPRRPVDQVVKPDQGTFEWTGEANGPYRAERPPTRDPRGRPSRETHAPRVDEIGHQAADPPR